jgi:hypothetical protein
MITIATDLTYQIEADGDSERKILEFDAGIATRRGSRAGVIGSPPVIALESLRELGYRVTIEPQQPRDGVVY